MKASFFSQSLVSGEHLIRAAIFIKDMLNSLLIFVSLFSSEKLFFGNDASCQLNWYILNFEHLQFY